MILEAVLLGGVAVMIGAGLALVSALHRKNRGCVWLGLITLCLAFWVLAGAALLAAA